MPLSDRLSDLLETFMQPLLKSIPIVTAAARNLWSSKAKPTHQDRSPAAPSGDSREHLGRMIHNELT